MHMTGKKEERNPIKRTHQFKSPIRTLTPTGPACVVHVCGFSAGMQRGMQG